MSEIKVEKASPKDAPENEEAIHDDKNKKVWKFKYKNYVEILPFVDTDAAPTPSGVKPNATVKARNFYLYLDLSDPKQKKKHDALMKSSQKDVSFWLVENADKRGKGLSAKGQTLDKLRKMGRVELSQMLSQAEWLEVGIIPATEPLSNLIVAVLERKTLSGGN